MQRLYVEIDDDVFRAIVDLALEERRSTRDQAAVLLERAVRQALRTRQSTRARPDGGVLVLEDDAREVAACAAG